MNYLDEVILKKREERKKQKYQSLKEGFYIDNTIIQFERELIEGIFTIMLPVEFKIIPEKFAQIKYPSAFRPRYIYTAKDLSVDIGFSIFSNNLQTDTKNTANRVIAAIRRNNPTHEFYEIKTQPDGNATWFSFRSHAMDCDMFNMILIKRFQTGILQSNFNCLLQKRELWERVVELVWESIEENKE